MEEGLSQEDKDPGLNSIQTLRDNCIVKLVNRLELDYEKVFILCRVRSSAGFIYAFVPTSNAIRHWLGLAATLTLTPFSFLISIVLGVYCDTYKSA